MSESEWDKYMKYMRFSKIKEGSNNVFIDFRPRHWWKIRSWMDFKLYLQRKGMIKR